MPREQLEAVKQRLTQPFHHELLETDDQRILFVRTSGAEPDPVADLEEAARRLPVSALQDVTHVVLLGAHGRFHVPGHHLAPLADLRQHLDAAAIDAFRESLDPNYGIGLQRLPHDPAQDLRLGIRIPRLRLVDLDDGDLLRIARSAGPLLDSRQANTVAFAYILAHDEHVRLPGTEFFEDIGPRWADLKSRPAPAATRIVAPTLPRRVISARPAIDLEIHVDAAPRAAPPPAPVLDWKESLRERLHVRGYETRADAQLGDRVFDVAAERVAGYPRRLLVVSAPTIHRTLAEELLRSARAAEADLLLAVSDAVDPDAARRLLATKVKVISTHEVAQLSL